MAASVRIEDCAFGDSRYARLAEAAGYRGGHYEALGRMAHLWRDCTERQMQVVSEGTIRAHLGKHGPRAILEAELGEPAEGGIRVKGTERISWLGHLRSSAKGGGQARAASARRGEGGRFGSSQAAGDPPATRLETAGPANPAVASVAVAVLTVQQQQQNRFADAPPAVGGSPAGGKAKNGASREVSGPDGEFLRHFDRALRKTHGTPYMAAMARDRKIAREIIAVYGLPLACEMVEAFFREHARAAGGADSWIGKAKPDVPGFLGQIPNLIREYRFDAKPPTGADHATSR